LVDTITENTVRSIVGKTRVGITYCTNQYTEVGLIRLTIWRLSVAKTISTISSLVGAVTEDAVRSIVGERISAITLGASAVRTS
jgi:hypothetical protein